MLYITQTEVDATSFTFQLLLVTSVDIRLSEDIRISENIRIIEDSIIGYQWISDIRHHVNRHWLMLGTINPCSVSF